MRDTDTGLPAWQAFWLAVIVAGTIALVGLCVGAALGGPDRAPTASPDRAFGFLVYREPSQRGQ